MKGGEGTCVRSALAWCPGHKVPLEKTPFATLCPLNVE